MPLGVGPRAVIIQPLKLHFFAHPSLPTPHISSGGLDSMFVLVDRPMLEVWTSPVCERGHSPASQERPNRTENKANKIRKLEIVSGGAHGAHRFLTTPALQNVREKARPIRERMEQSPVIQVGKAILPYCRRPGGPP